MSAEMHDISGDYRAQLAIAVQLALSVFVESTEALAILLYDQWYAPPAVEPAIHTSPAELVAHLCAVDAAGSRFDAGWTVVDPQIAAQNIGPATSPWQLPVACDGELRWVDPIDFVYLDAVGLRPPVGASVIVSQRRDSWHILPGWWTALSPAWSEDAKPMLRLYWSVQPAGVCRLVEALTSLFDPALPYALKCPTDLSRYHRADAITLYLPAAAWQNAKDILQIAYARCENMFRETVPSFTLSLARGLALAENPATDSFGMSRCRTLAEGMWEALNSRDPQSIVLAAENGFRQYGIDLDAPYLNPNSKAQYRW